MKNSRLFSFDTAGDKDGRQFSRVVTVVPRRRLWTALSLLLAMALVIGCARQYHLYDCGCGCVNYRYCPPAPLPYAPYDSCPTPIATCYDLQAEQSQSVEGLTEGTRELPTPGDYPGQ